MQKLHELISFSIILMISLIHSYLKVFVHSYCNMHHNIEKRVTNYIFISNTLKHLFFYRIFLVFWIFQLISIDLDIDQYRSISCTQVDLMVPTRNWRASTTWGRISPPMSTYMISSPTCNSPWFSHTFI
mgnify:CR=1 FL=1